MFPAQEGEKSATHEVLAAPQDHQTAVEAAVRGEVGNPLDAVKKLSLRRPEAEGKAEQVSAVIV